MMSGLFQLIYQPVRHTLGLINMTLDNSLNVKPSNMLCIYLSFSCEAVMHIIISRDIFSNKISRDIFALFLLFCTKGKLSDADIFGDS